MVDTKQTGRMQASTPNKANEPAAAPHAGAVTDINELKRQVKKLLEQKAARKEYQRKRNLKPEAREKRKAYNKVRYEHQKALLEQAKKMGLLPAEASSEQ